jgi:glycosyltransferase involved in cell wall biosynthesis
MNRRNQSIQRLRKRMFEGRPKVTVVTPTYNRRQFIPQLIKYYKYQTYPLDKIEFIIIDDGDDPVKDLIDELCDGLNIRYIRHDEKITIGEKRNMLNDLASHEFIVCMDDDDYYPPNRVEHAVERLIMSGKELAGCSNMYTFFTQDNEIWAYGPYGINHGTNGTMAYKKSYTKYHTHDTSKKFAEESSFTKGFTIPMVQLDPLSTIVCIAHKNNTFAKQKRGKIRKVTSNPGEYLSSDVLDFYKSLTN